MRNLYRFGASALKIGMVLVVLTFFVVSCSSDDNGTDSVNHNPTITVSCSPSQLSSSGGTVTVSATASDQDGDPLTYTYSASFGTGLPSGSTSSSSASWTLPQNTGTNSQQYQVTVTVSDGKGGTASASGGVTVAAAAAQTTNISGTCSLQAGMTGNLDNGRVAIYTSIAEWAADAPVRWVAAVGVGLGATATYTISNVVPGNYFIDYFKDNDNSASYTINDFFGWYGSGAYPNNIQLTQFQAIEGQTATINMTIIVL
ncbi:MAG: hypothetical protein KAT58_02425 [candidate division Zixibacteria bacterium]|nr:hypothetical protein [candidate division Zixibacteria bacterium]